MSKRARNVLCSILSAVLLSAGTATITHVWDARTAATNQVRDFNDGWLNGVCEGNPVLARTAYGMTNCK